MSPKSVCSQWRLQGIWFWQKTLWISFRVYRWGISPLLHGFMTSVAGAPAGCRFHPSCSVYAEEVLARFGGFQGMKLTLLRLACCHPWAGAGDRKSVRQACSDKSVGGKT